MGQQWYYSKDGQNQGPVNQAALKQLAATGEITPATMVWTEGLPEWTPASKLKGLFGAAGAPAPAPAAPARQPAAAPVAGAEPEPQSAEQQWYYTQNGQRLGPVTWGALAQLGATGQLHPADLVWTDGMAQWSQAAQISGLIPQLAGADASSAAAGFGGGAPLNYYAPQQAVEFAGFWLRFCAAILDGIITGIIGFVVGAVIGFVIASAMRGTSTQQAILAVVQLVSNAAGILIGWLYSALQESGSGQATIGKRAVGIYVTTLTGERISFGRASGRHFGKIVSTLILLIGYIMAGFTEKKQALHDIMAGTLVVKGKPMA